MLLQLMCLLRKWQKNSVFRGQDDTKLCIFVTRQKVNYYYIYYDVRHYCVLYLVLTGFDSKSILEFLMLDCNVFKIKGHRFDNTLRRFNWNTQHKKKLARIKCRDYCSSSRHSRCKKFPFGLLALLILIAKVILNSKIMEFKFE